MPSKAKASPEKEEFPEKETPKQAESSPKLPQPPASKYAPKPKVVPTIGKNQIGGKKQRVTPKFNSVSTQLN